MSLTFQQNTDLVPPWTGIVYADPDYIMTANSVKYDTEVLSLFVIAGLLSSQETGIVKLGFAMEVWYLSSLSSHQLPYLWVVVSGRFPGARFD